jgi:hypothetical protein
MQNAGCRVGVAAMRAKKPVFGAVTAVAALLIAGCTGDSFVYGGHAKVAGHWHIEQQTDRVTGAQISSAQVNTRRVSNGNLPFVAPPASLQLACFKQQPTVVIKFEFKIGSTRNAEVGYAVDNRPGRQPAVRIVEDYKTIVIEDQDEVRRFAGELATANILYIRIRALNAQRTSAEFLVDGAPEAIAAAYASCPLTPPTRTSVAPPAAHAAAAN